MNEQLLKFENISKNYGSLEALKNINFSIPENSIFGIYSSILPCEVGTGQYVISMVILNTPPSKQIQ